MEQSISDDGRGLSLFGRHTFKQEADDLPALPIWSPWWSIIYNFVWPVIVLPALLAWFTLSLIPYGLLATYFSRKCGQKITLALTGPLYTVYAFGVLSQLVIAKWILISRFTQGVYQIDSIWFLRRLAYAHCLDFAGMVCLESLKGTISLPWVYRALGARIGSRAHIDTLAITEPDLIEIGDDCSINSSVILFAHSLDRGHFSQAPLKIGKRSTIHSHSLLLLGTTLGESTHLEHSSATMMNSTTVGSAKYAGVPPQLQRSSAALSDAYQAWKKQNTSAATSTTLAVRSSPDSPASSLPHAPAVSSMHIRDTANLSRNLDKSSRIASTSGKILIDKQAWKGTQKSDLGIPQEQKRPIFQSQHKGAKPEYRSPETLDQPKSEKNIVSLMDIFSNSRDKARTSLEAIDKAFKDEVQCWQQHFSAKLTELPAGIPDTKDALLNLGRFEATTEDLDILVAEVRNMPGSGDTTAFKGQDASLTDWAEHRQQLSARAERLRDPRPYADHSTYVGNIQQTYGIVALDLMCQGEIDWMVWQSFAWTVPHPSPSCFEISLICALPDTSLSGSTNDSIISFFEAFVQSFCE